MKKHIQSIYIFCTMFLTLLNACSLFEEETVPEFYNYRSIRFTPIVGEQEFDYLPDIIPFIYAGDTVSFEIQIAVTRQAIIDSIKVYKRIVPPDGQYDYAPDTKFYLVKNHAKILNYDIDDSTTARFDEGGIGKRIKFTYKYEVTKDGEGRTVEFLFIPFCSNIPSQFTLFNNGNELINNNGGPAHLRYKISAPDIRNELRIYNIKGEKRNMLYNHGYDLEDIRLDSIKRAPGEYILERYSSAYILLHNYFDRENYLSKEFIRGLEVSSFGEAFPKDRWIIKLPETPFDSSPAELINLYKKYKHQKEHKVKDIKVGDTFLINLPDYRSVYDETCNCSEYKNCARIALAEIIDIADDQNTSDSVGRDDDYLLLKMKIFNAYRF